MSVLKHFVFIFVVIYPFIFAWKYAQVEYEHHCKVKYERTLKNIRRLEEWNDTH